MKNLAVWVIAACCVVAVAGGAAYWWRAEQKAVAAEAARVALVASEKAKAELATIGAAEGSLRGTLLLAAHDFKTTPVSRGDLSLTGQQLAMFTKHTEIMLAKVPDCLKLAQVKSENAVKSLARFYELANERQYREAGLLAEGLEPGLQSALAEVAQGCAARKKTLEGLVIR